MAQKETGRENVMKWVKFISFGLVLFGGIMWLMVGLFNFDLIGGVFGGSGSVFSRVVYTLFGIAAVTLLTTVLMKAFEKNQAKRTRVAKATK